MSNHMVTTARRLDARGVNTISTALSHSHLARVLGAMTSTRGPHVLVRWLLWGLAAAAALAAPATARADSVRFYEHVNLQGNSFELPSTSAPIGVGVQGSIPDFRRQKLACGSATGCKDFNDRV